MSSRFVTVPLQLAAVGLRQADTYHSNAYFVDIVLSIDSAAVPDTTPSIYLALSSMVPLGMDWI